MIRKVAGLAVSLLGFVVLGLASTSYSFGRTFDHALLLVLIMWLGVFSVLVIRERATGRPDTLFQRYLRWMTDENRQ